MNLVATAVVGMAVVYFQKWRIELPVSSTPLLPSGGPCYEMSSVF